MELAELFRGHSLNPTNAGGKEDVSDNEDASDNEDPCTKPPKEHPAILTENEQLQTCNHGMEQEKARLIGDWNALRSSLDLLMRRAEEMEKKNNDLQLKIDKLEALLGRQAYGGSSKDSEATPHLLQLAADGVKDAIADFAGEFFSTFKQNPSIDFDHAVEDGIRVGLTSSTAVKASLQAMICRVFFQGFEDPDFPLSEKFVPPFQTPSEQKSALLQEFWRCRDASDIKQLLLDDFVFRLFFKTKVAAMNQEIAARLLRPTKVQVAVENFADGVFNPENENSIYRGNFLRAAKTVWMLHKLALSFEPRAEIFRVGLSSSLNTIYMDDIATRNEDPIGVLLLRVMFMCVPGFTVRNTVIKSKVLLLQLPVKLKAAETDNGATS